MTNHTPENVMMTEYGFCVRTTAGTPYNKLLVSGLGRSGTSAIASMLKHIGYYVGRVDTVVTNEDKILQGLLKNNLYPEIIEEISRREKTHPLLAWKNPKLIDESGIKLIQMLPDDWTFILTSRDPLSIAMRLTKQHGTNILSNFGATLERQKRIFLAIRLVHPKPVIVVSYDKLLADPERAILGLLIDINPGLLETTDIKMLSKSIISDQSKYLAACNHTITEKTNN